MSTGESTAGASHSAYEVSQRLDGSPEGLKLAESAEKVRIAGPAFTVALRSSLDLEPGERTQKRLRKLLAKALHGELDREYRLERVALYDRTIEIKVSANTSYSRQRSIVPNTRPSWPACVDAATEAMRWTAFHVLSEEAPELELEAEWELGNMVFVEAVALPEDAPVAAIQDTLRDRGDRVTRLESIRVPIIGLASLFAVASAVVGILAHELFIPSYLLVYSLLILAFLPLVNGRLASVRNEVAELKERLELRDLLDEEERRAFRLFQIHNLDLKRYYDLALSQRRFIFGLGSFCIVLGSGVAVTALVLLGDGDTSSQQKLLISGIGAVGAILANFVAVIYLRMFRDTVESMNTFHNRLVATHHLLFGNLLAARIGDQGKRDETLAAMASSVAHIDSGGDRGGSSGNGKAASG